MRRGGLGENPGLFFFPECVTQSGLRGDRNNENRTRNVTKEKTTYLLDGKPHVNEKERKRRGIPAKRNRGK